MKIGKQFKVEVMRVGKTVNIDGIDIKPTFSDLWDYMIICNHRRSILADFSMLCIKKVHVGCGFILNLEIKRNSLYANGMWTDYDYPKRYESMQTKKIKITTSPSEYFTLYKINNN